MITAPICPKCLVRPRLARRALGYGPWCSYCSECTKGHLKQYRKAAPSTAKLHRMADQYRPKEEK